MVAEAAAGTGGIALNVLAIGVVVLFVFALLLPKKLHYIVNGVVLVVLGGVHILYELYFTDIDIRGNPIVRFVIAFVVMVTSKELIAESIHEKGKGMKAITFFIGFVLIFLAVLPELYHYGAVSFELPEFPLLFSFLYIIGGLVAIAAPFFLERQ